MQVTMNDDAGEMLQQEGVITGQTDIRVLEAMLVWEVKEIGPRGMLWFCSRLRIRLGKGPAVREPVAKRNASRVPPAASPVPMGNLSLCCGCAVPRGCEEPGSSRHGWILS